MLNGISERPSGARKWYRLHRIRSRKECPNESDEVVENWNAFGDYKWDGTIKYDAGTEHLH